MDLEVGFAGRKTTDIPYDQDELMQWVIDNYQYQMFAPGQQFVTDVKGISLKLQVRTVQLGDLSAEKMSKGGASVSDPNSRGILNKYTTMNFFKDTKTAINLKASTRRPAANAIIQPDFKFEEMGIGGLDAEFGVIFRRAFASRIFPPGIVQKLGIQHVKGILLYGPPGTGKTLIARKIGKMLNAREPKVINGPEVLNKFVGQSEENIRKLFADAEKEYKEKGDESGLHIIIFDELDAVCKQRGSGAAGGTGVGDSVVNQLLSKLDGVDQLNNILLIGMTNRKDMIDEALLRSGRLELHVEIGLPDEKGRVQIFNIHTANMRNNKIMAPDVSIPELAAHTKNFSGAEISGVVRAAASFAFQRHTKVGSMAGVSEDVVNLKVNREDFLHALDEVHSAFGVSETSLKQCLEKGIFHYSSTIESILRQGSLYIDQVRNLPSSSLLSVLVHGPPGSGKTALAAKMALDSDFPFVQLISAKEMIGLSEAQKVASISKVFHDAYKSPLSLVLVDNIEDLIDWQPIGPRFSNFVVSNLRVLLAKEPPAGRRLLVLATSGEHTTLRQLNVLRAFNKTIAVPYLRGPEELERVLKEANAFDGDEGKRGAAVREVQREMASSSAGEFSLSIKDVLDAVDTARMEARQGGDVVSRFVSEITQVSMLVSEGDFA